MNMIKTFIKRLKVNNSGSTIVTVIVVATFLSILATIILYLSGQNFMMKETNRGTVENFYQSETVLEEVKMGLCEVAAKAAEDAYVQTMVMFSVTSPFTRYETFETKFFENLEKEWDKKLTETPGITLTYADLLNNMVPTDYAGTFSLAPGCDGSLDMSEASSGYVYLRGLQVSYTGSQGYYTRIETDFVFTVPVMNWGVSESYKTLTEEHGTEEVDKRNSYDISDYVNYINWVKSGN